MNEIPLIDDPETMTVQMIPAEEFRRFVGLVNRMRRLQREYHRLLKQQPHFWHSDFHREVQRAERDVDSAIAEKSQVTTRGMFEGGDR